jgi:hypothetical protein
MKLCDSCSYYTRICTGKPEYDGQLGKTLDCIGVILGRQPRRCRLFGAYSMIERSRAENGIKEFVDEINLNGLKKI